MKCLHCNKPLLGKYQKKFCNRSCSASYNNTFKIKNGRYLEKSCTICNEKTNNPKFCSLLCRNTNLSKPRKYRTQEEKDKNRKLLQREAYARYSAKKKNQTPADADLKAIKEFYLGCPAGYEVDHIIPISRGGLHTLPNLQYLTITENRKKSNKILVPPPRIELGPSL